MRRNLLLELRIRGFGILWIRCLIFKPIGEFRKKLRQHAEMCLKIYDVLDKQKLQPVIRLDAVSENVSKIKPHGLFDLFCLESYAKFEVKTSKQDKCLVKQIVSTNFYLFCFLKSNKVMVGYGKCLKKQELKRVDTGYDVCYVVTPENPCLKQIGVCKPFRITEKLDYNFLKGLKDVD